MEDDHDLHVHLHSAKFQLSLLQDEAKVALKYGQDYYEYIDCSRLYIPPKMRVIDGHPIDSCLELWCHDYDLYQTHEHEQILSIILKRSGITNRIFELTGKHGRCIFDWISLDAFRLLMQQTSYDTLDWNARVGPYGSILHIISHGYENNTDERDWNNADARTMDSARRERLRKILFGWDAECQTLLQKMHFLATTSDADYDRFEQALNWVDENGHSILHLTVMNGHIKTFESLVAFHPMIHFDYESLQQAKEKGDFYSPDIREEYKRSELMNTLMYSTELYHQNYLKRVSNILQTVTTGLVRDVQVIVCLYLGLRDHRNQEDLQSKTTVVGAKRKRLRKDDEKEESDDDDDDEEEDNNQDEN